jgi:hypothetical protein
MLLARCSESLNCEADRGDRNIAPNVAGHVGVLLEPSIKFGAGFEFDVGSRPNHATCVV